MAKAKMTKVEREEAKLAAEQMLVQRYDHNRVVRAIVKNYACTEKTAENIVGSVYREWKKDSSAKRVERRELQVRSLQELYRKAFKSKKWRDCVEIEKLLARIDGTMEPDRVLMGPMDDDKEMDDRSVEELEYYAEHGYYPDEAPGAVPAAPDTRH